MKRILITGADSYIGTSFENWVSKWPEKYKIETVDVKDNFWREKSFASYDVVFHVAAIVHETLANANQYYKVNRDLAVEVAKKSKTDGVKQFVFLSTMGVYGITKGFIDINAKPNQKTYYSASKLQAEELLNELADDSFIVTVLRLPIVYGKGCKGNYPRLSRIAARVPIFPNINNKRSMLFIDNLSKFLTIIIDKELGGVLFPQNREYINTSELVKLIAELHGNRIRLTRIFNPFVHLATAVSVTAAKVFGSLMYDKNLPGGPNEFDYETCSFAESIEKTEK